MLKCKLSVIRYDVRPGNSSENCPASVAKLEYDPAHNTPWG